MTIFGYGIVNIKKLKDGFKSEGTTTEVKPVVDFKIVENKLSGIQLAVENGEYIFPEFSSLPDEEGRVASLRALSVCKRLVGFIQESENGNED